MTPEETTGALAYAGQLDGRIEANPATLEVWGDALAHAHADQVRWVIKNFYATTDGRSPITPGQIRKTIREETERAVSKRAALDRAGREPQPNVIKQMGRRQESDEYQRAMHQGALDHLADLERRGIIRPDQQARLDTARQTGTYTPPTGGFFR